MKKLVITLLAALCLFAPSQVHGQNILVRQLTCVDAGSTDDYACSISTSPGSYGVGVHYSFVANTANTGVAKINFNTIGQKTIKKAAGGVTTDLADNDIRAGQWVDLIYDGTYMQMQSGLGNASAGGGGNITQGETKMLALCEPTASSTDVQWAGDTNSASITCGGATFPASVTAAWTALADSVKTLNRTTFMLPHNWDSSTAIDVVIFWGAGDSPASGNVYLSAELSCQATSAAFTAAVTYNTPTTLAVSEGSTANLRKLTVLAGLDKTGCAVDSPVALRVGRDGTDGSDTSTTNAYFLGARLFYRTTN